MDRDARIDSNYGSYTAVRISVNDIRRKMEYEKESLRKNKMKLCLVAPVPPPFGGVANWEQIVVNEIKKHEDISLSLINIAANKRVTDGRNIFDRVFYSGYIMLRAYCQLKRIVKNNPPDVVHMTTSGGLGFFRDLLLLNYLKKRSIFSVYHVHFGRSVKYKAEGGRCWRQLIKAVSAANVTIAIDKTTYKILKPFARHIECINNPINASEYKEFENTKTNTILYIGWIIKAKGIEELLSAFSIFNNRNNNVYSLEMIGPGSEEYISALKKNYDFSHVNLTGEVEHKEAMKRLSKARALVLPSYTEGFPNVILEAMALGKCIIATDVGAIPEMLKGDAGILIKPYRVDEIVSALEQIKDDEVICRYGENANKRVKQEYDIGITFERYRNVWQKSSRGVPKKV
jgi:Glycosyltransferase